MTIRRVLLLVLLVSIPLTAQRQSAPTRTELAPGVFLFTTPSYGDVGLDGNSIAILSRDGVLVFDTNGTPAAAEAVLGQIRALTGQPVRWVVSSHWHWDHWYGTEVYQQAFPDVRIVAHEKTRETMMEPALDFNRPGLETQLPNYLQTLEKRAADSSSLRALLDEGRFFLEQKSRVRHTFPNVTFSDRLNIELGERHIEVRHYGRGVTPGDAFVYLPAEKILLLGDLIVNPITFALSGCPTEWLRTLEKIDALDATTIVTGHDAPPHDKTLLRTTMEVFRVLLREGKAAKARGLRLASPASSHRARRRPSAVRDLLQFSATEETFDIAVTAVSPIEKPIPFEFSLGCSLAQIDRVGAPKRFVYVLNSDSEPKCYDTGLTSDVAARLNAHNAGLSPHTADGRPWRPVVVIEFADQHRAVKFEKYLKSGSGRAFARRHFR